MRIIKVRYLAATDYRSRRLKYINIADNKTLKTVSRDYSLDLHDQVLRDIEEFKVIQVVESTGSNENYIIVK